MNLLNVKIRNGHLGRNREIVRVKHVKCKVKNNRTVILHLFNQERSSLSILRYNVHANLFEI